MRSEAQYQNELITKVIPRFIPGAMVIKNDASYVQGIPDLLILFDDQWAMLEVKRSEFDPFQPNQEYYLDMFNSMSFGAVIYPGVEEEVMRDLQEAFGIARQARIFEPQ